jgi:membrane-bound metal-dependent hydrolase YbcI (DUF457 family)
MALLATLLVWQGVDQAQARLPLSLAWAILDVMSHAAVAALVMLWTVPAWGWRPLIAAVLAAALIDVDHALAARSILPSRLMSLAARPASHSLLGVAVASGVGWLAGGRRVAFAAGVGILTHVLGDAQSEPGVPLWVPWSAADWHVMLPRWTLPVLLVCLAAVSAAWAANWPRVPSARRPSPSR